MKRPINLTVERLADLAMKKLTNGLSDEEAVKPVTNGNQLIVISCRRNDTIRLTNTEEMKYWLSLRLSCPVWRHCCGGTVTKLYRRRIKSVKPMLTKRGDEIDIAGIEHYHYSVR